MWKNNAGASKLYSLHQKVCSKNGAHCSIKYAVNLIAAAVILLQFFMKSIPDSNTVVETE